MIKYRPTEYIVDFGDCKSSAFVGLAIADAEQHGAKLEEKIVRCKDCIHFNKGCELFEFYMCCMEEMGFCAWGDRKDQ